MTALVKQPVCAEWQGRPGALNSDSIWAKVRGQWGDFTATYVVDYNSLKSLPAATQTRFMSNTVRGYCSNHRHRFPAVCQPQLSGLGRPRFHRQAEHADLGPWPDAAARRRAAAEVQVDYRPALLSGQSASDPLFAAGRYRPRRRAPRKSGSSRTPSRPSAPTRSRRNSRSSATAMVSNMSLAFTISRSMATRPCRAYRPSYAHRRSRW